MTDLDTIDKIILNRIQSDFPIDERPFRVIADELGLAEADVITRVQRFKQNGIIRRIGGNFSPEKLGFVSTLCAGKVPDEEIDKFAEIVNSYPGVTHNYLRANTYNIWFTFIAPSHRCIDENLAEIAEKTGVKKILNMPATAVYKIRAQFNLK